MTLKRMERKPREHGAVGSNDRRCYTCGEVGHPARKFPNREKVLVAWKVKKATSNKGTEQNEKGKHERRRGSHSGHKKGGYGGRGWGKPQSLHLAQTSGGENDNAKVPKVQELSDSASNDDDDLDDSGSGNGDGTDLVRIHSLNLKLLLCQ